MTIYWRALASVLAIVATVVPKAPAADEPAKRAAGSIVWRYTTAKPGEDWQQPDFDDSGWKQGPGGFGTAGTPGARIGTEWRTGEIWLRRTVRLDKVPANPALYVHHDEDAEIYLNGKKVASLSGYTTRYEIVPLTKEGRTALRAGENLLAVHCRQTGGGQYIDAAVIDGSDPPRSPDEPGPPTMKTRWAAKLDPDKPLPEYPRPQMVRERWVNLNGKWDYAIRPKDEPQPKEWDGKIVVPFPVESQLSGVQRRVGQESLLWYRRGFDAPKLGDDGRLLLHFGAVDWHATAWVNGKKVGEHKGGYDPFTFDITDALKSDGTQELVVSVWDPTDAGSQARGKQVRDPHGIWYTPVTGIWQTVWLEPVPKHWIDRLKLTPDFDAGKLKVQVELGAGSPARGEFLVDVKVLDGEKGIASSSGSAADVVEVSIPDAKLWSPSDPFLYGVDVRLRGKDADSVTSDFGMRKIELKKDERGFNMLFLNNKPLFQFGPLDQGWWPDGLYTAPTDEALKYDVEITKKLGFNMLRKHVKVEPARFYHHCDRLGMLVWQDMPSGFDGPQLRVGPADKQDAKRDPESARQFEAELKAMIDHLHNHPSIVMWVPFNEGWGQYDTARIAEWVKKYDPTRLCNAVSGWADRDVSDIEDVHMYPGPGMEPAETDRAAVLGEYGGLGWPVEGHLWWNKRNWGYRTYQSREELNRQYRRLLDGLEGLLGLGLAAAVYTQTTDVEGEVNGLMTYDRGVVKFDPDEFRRLHARLYAPAGKAQILLPDSELEPQSWRYARKAPGEGWQEPGFDDAEWNEGKAPFASGGSPFFPTGTKWPAESNEIWLRRTFRIETPPSDLRLKVYHDVADAKVYINGNPVAELVGDTHRHYGHIDLSEHAEVLRAGENVIAIHAAKPKGHRGIDAGLYAVGRAD